MADTDVKYFDSTMVGATDGSSTAGTAITILDQCLINGFGQVTLDSLVVSSGVATATYSAGHGFTNHGTKGPVITIAGATPSGLNSEHRIIVTSTTAFTFVTAEADGTATGTITAKRSPLGWTKAFSGTNSGAYKSTGLGASGYHILVDDNQANYSIVRGYESMTSISAGTNPFPTVVQSVTGLYLFRANAASGRTWYVVGDDRFFYFVTAPTSAIHQSGLNFGDINSFSAQDSDAVFITASISTSGAAYITNLAGSYTAQYLARPVTGAVGAVAAGKYSHGKSGSYIGSAGETYPSPVDAGLATAPVEVWETASIAMGNLPGLFNPVHLSGLSVDTAFDGPSQAPDGILLVKNLGASATRVALFDVIGPWR